MTKKIIQKVSEIMELAVKVNSSETRQELTDVKPTFFVTFSGHICSLAVRAYVNGYPEETVILYLSRKGVTRGYEATFLDGEEKPVLHALDTVLAEMRRIINEWEVTQ